MRLRGLAGAIAFNGTGEADLVEAVRFLDLLGGVAGDGCSGGEGGDVEVGMRDDVGGVAPGQCSRPVPALTCVAGNCGVRSSGKKPKRVPFHPGAQARGRPDGRT